MIKELLNVGGNAICNTEPQVINIGNITKIKGVPKKVCIQSTHKM